MDMATYFQMLLIFLIYDNHKEELVIIRKERGSHSFKLPKEANSCLISRFVGEEKLVLWNTSDLWSENSTVPEDLKQRLSVVSEKNIPSYIIHNLTHSDSGPYREECWTGGNVTHEKNISITVCTSIYRKSINVRPGETAVLPCIGAADNLDVQWLKRDFRNEKEIWTRVFGDNGTSVMDNVRGRYQVVKNTSALRVSNSTITDYTSYMCLVMNQQQCVSSNTVVLKVEAKTVFYRSVEETAVLPCTVTTFTNNKPPCWFNDDFRQLTTSVDQNYSLVFPSLTLNHTGRYFCKASVREQHYWLVVCPKFGPPAVEFFSKGEEVTVRCRLSEKRMKGHYWFIKSNRTEGRTTERYYPSKDGNTHDGRLVISNVSVEDTGEYWCAVLDSDRHQCVSTSRTLLKYREPFGIHSVIYAVRCAVLSALLATLCVAAVAVNLRTRRGEPLSAETES